MRWQMLSLTSLILAACGGENSTEIGQDTGAFVDRQGQALASACSGCHAVGGSALSDLTGWSSEAIISSMTSYKDDVGGTTVMHRLARGYSAEEIELVARFLEAEWGQPRD